MYEKYVESLRLMDSVVEANSTAESQPDTVIQEWDTLFDFIHANFEIPKSSGARSTDNLREELDLCKPFIDRTYAPGSEQLEKMIRSIPPVILDVVWPVSIARWLIRDVRVRFDHRKSTTFGLFHTRYGNIILNCNISNNC